MTVPFSAPKDTLAYQLGTRPLTRMIDFSQVQTSEVMPEFSDKLSPDLAKPEVDALWFYLMNHAVARVRELRDPNEPLGEYAWVLNEYHKQSADRAVRAFRYLMLITTREARHASNYLNSGDWVKVREQSSDVAGSYVQQYIAGSGGGEEGAAGNLKNKPPACTVGEYVMAIRATFYNGSWAKGSTSYGGKKWGVVTDCLMEYVFGRYSAEMMLDTVWTLCHNGGPIFNKGMLYHHYSGHALKLILDVQRSGQVPHLLLETVHHSAYQVQEYATPEVRAMAQKIATAVPGIVDLSKPVYVDWLRVKALGGIGSWSVYEKQQLAKYGQPDDPTYLAKMAAEQKAAIEKAQQQAAKKAEAMAKAAEIKANGWQVMPGLTLQKFQPQRSEEKVTA